MVALAVSQSIATLEWLNSGHFSPATLFATSEPGVWYDPSDVANTNWRYNLLTFTEQFDNAAWARTSGTTATANQSVAPDGTTTADLITSGGAAGYIYPSSTGLFAAAGGATYTYSVYAKSGTATTIQLLVAATATYTGTYNLSTGVATTASANTTVSMVNVGNGWYRCIITCANVANTVYTEAQIGRVALGLTFSLWGAQLEVGNTATTYQPITTVEAETIARFPQATLYQDSAGTTPVTAPAQPVGLMLDKKNGLVLGSELVVNGDFASDTWWSKDATATISSGVGVFTNTSASSGFFRSNLLEVGKSYRVTYTIVSMSSGAIRVLLGSGSSVVRSAAGTYSEVIQCAGTTQLYIQAFSGSATNATIDNISVRELPGTHATQSTSASRPTYGIVPATGRRNLLTFSEQFDNAAWTKSQSTVTAASGISPSGLNNAFLLTSTGSFPAVYLTTPLSGSGNVTFSYFVKDGTSGQSILRVTGTDVGGAGNTEAVYRFTISTATIARVQGGTGTTSVQALANGWYRISLSLSTTTYNNAAIYPRWSDATSATILIWGAQLETGSTATAYQRVVTAFEVTEANVASLSYISFDGVDDFMVTPTIDPSAGVTPGPELITNGNFASGTTGWTDITGAWAVTGGALAGTSVSANAFGPYSNNTDVIAGRTYLATFTLVVTSGSLLVRVGNTQSTGYTSSGTFTLPIVATTSGVTSFQVRAGASGFTGTIDNISVREIVADKVQVFAGVRKLSDAAVGSVVESSVGSGNGRFQLSAPVTVAPNYGFTSVGTSASFAVSVTPTFVAPITNIITGTSDIAADSAILRVNGTERATSSSDQGSGNYLANQLFIGRRGGTTLPFNGQMYGLITRFGPNLNTSQLVSTEGWMNTKTRPL